MLGDKEQSMDYFEGVSPTEKRILGIGTIILRAVFFLNFVRFVFCGEASLARSG